MKYLAYVFVVLVAGAVIFGLWSIGSPETARKARMDDIRVSNLINLQEQIIYYWQGKGALPSALSDLKDETRGVFVPVDPETRKEYSYKRTGNLSFELCADFLLDSGTYAGKKIAGEPNAVGSFSWSHPAGTFCFAREIDPAFYKPIK
jgi:hypothetical protein